MLLFGSDTAVAKSLARQLLSLGIISAISPTEREEHVMADQQNEGGQGQGRNQKQQDDRRHDQSGQPQRGGQTEKKPGQK